MTITLEQSRTASIVLTGSDWCRMSHSTTVLQDYFRSTRGSAGTQHAPMRVVFASVTGPDYSNFASLADLRARLETDLGGLAAPSAERVPAAVQFLTFFAAMTGTTVILGGADPQTRCVAATARRAVMAPAPTDGSQNGPPLLFRVADARFCLAPAPSQGAAMILVNAEFGREDAPPRPAEAELRAAAEQIFTSLRFHAEH